LRRISTEGDPRRSTTPNWTTKREAQVPFESMLDALTQQKEELRRSQSAQDAAALARRPGKRRPPRQEASSPQLRPSTLHGSASFSFGKPRHRKGRFGLPVLEARDIEYVKPTGGVVVPGPGHYDHSHSDGKGLSATEGHTGGWTWSDHNVFMKTLKEHKDNLGVAFWDRLHFLLPHIHRKGFTDHLRWFADSEATTAKRHRTMHRFLAETSGEEVPVDRKQQAQLMQNVRTWREQADAEDARLGLKNRDIVFQNSQCFGGKVIEVNMRAHPEYKKSPAYSFHTSRELRDPMQKQHTNLAHVRSTSALDVPGPGAYNAIEAHRAVLARCPVYGLHDRTRPPKVDAPAVGGPGYDGPLDAAFKLQDDIRATQHTLPAYTISRAPRKAPWLADKTRSVTATEPHVGPGTYVHVTGFHSQY